MSGVAKTNINQTVIYSTIMKKALASAIRTGDLVLSVPTVAPVVVLVVALILEHRFGLHLLAHMARRVILFGNMDVIKGIG